MGIRKTGGVLFSVCILLSMATAALAQDCVTFNPVPSHATFVLRGSLIGSSTQPNTFCSLIPKQSYFLKMQAPGYEPRTLKFALGDNGKIDFSGERAEYTLRTMVIPGWGYKAYGNLTRALWEFFITGSTAAYTIVAYNDYQKQKDDYDAKEKRFLEATTQASKESLGRQALDASQRSNTKRERFVETAALTGWVYASNVVEIFLVTAPPSIRSVNGSTVTVEIPERSKSRTVMRSLFFPGMGQKYQDRYLRGALFQASVVMTALFAIETRADYRDAENAYDTAKSDFDNATSVGDKTSKQEIAAQKFEDLDKKKQNRDISYIALGTVWLLNVLDAMAISKPPGPSLPPAVGINTSYRNSMIQTSISLKF